MDYWNDILPEPQEMGLFSNAAAEDSCIRIEKIELISKHEIGGKNLT